jgi:hypothetical protein
VQQWASGTAAVLAGGGGGGDKDSRRSPSPAPEAAPAGKRGREGEGEEPGSNKKSKTPTPPNAAAEEAQQQFIQTCQRMEAIWQGNLDREETEHNSLLKQVLQHGE